MALQRRLGLPGAVAIGIGSMVGAGVFTLGRVLGDEGLGASTDPCEMP